MGRAKLQDEEIDAKSSAVRTLCDETPRKSFSADWHTRDFPQFFFVSSNGTSSYRGALCRFIPGGPSAGGTGPAARFSAEIGACAHSGEAGHGGARSKIRKACQTCRSKDGQSRCRQNRQGDHCARKQ